MTSLNLKFEKVSKDRLFYNRWKYSVTFLLYEASVLRDLDPAVIDAKLDQRIEWRGIARKRYANHGRIGSVTGRWREITNDIRATIQQVCKFLLDTSYEYKLVVTTNHVWLYTNDRDLLEQINGMDDLLFKHYCKAVITRPKNTVLLKKSKYTDRSYFARTKLTLEQKNQLRNFLTNQVEHIRISPALVVWLKQEFQRTQDYFFIDHNGDHWLTMLSLVQPGLIRKTQQIITTK